MSSEFTHNDSNDELRQKHRLRCANVMTLRVVVSLVLLAAAYLKARAGPAGDLGLFTHLLLLHAEVALGCWLLNGWYPRLASAVGSTCFAVFAVYSGGRAIAGHHSCGCFGDFAVNPWITASVDALLAVGLGLSSKLAPGEPNRFRIKKVVISSMIGAGILAVVWWPQATTNVGDSGLASLGTASGNLIVLEPEKWLDQNLVLASYIENGDILLDGEWIIVLYQHGCSTCQLAIPRYRESMSGNHTGYPRLALIEVNAADEVHWSNGGVWESHLLAEYDWSVSTPVVLHVHNAKVFQVETGEDAIDARRLLSEWGIADRNTTPNRVPTAIPPAAAAFR